MYCPRKLNNKILREFSFKRIFLTSILINIFIFSLFFITVTPAADEIDDVLMMMISSGALSGDPSEFLIYINIGIGNVLKILYENIPSVNWYVIFIYLCHFLSMVSILYVFLKLKNNLFSIILFIILFVLFELHLLISVQFTSTAFMVGFSGFFLFILSLNDHVTNKLRFMLIALMLIELATLIRFSAMLGIMLMIIPILTLKYMNMRCIRIPLFIGVIFVISYGLNMLDNYYYAAKLGSPNPMEYQKSINALANNPLKIKDEYLREVGWTLNDIDLIREWFWMDKDVYSHDKVVKFYNIAKTQNDFEMVLNQLYAYMTLKGKRYMVYGLFCILYTCLLIPQKEIKYVIVSLLTLSVAYLLLLVYFKAPHRGVLPDRVVLPLMFFVFYYCFYLILESYQYDKINMHITIKSIFVLIILMSIQMYKIIDESRINNHNHDDYYKAFEDINSVKDSLFLVSGGTIHHVFRSTPLFINQKRYSACNIIYSGWMAHTPTYNKILEKFKIDDLSRTLCRSSKVFLIGWNKSFDKYLIKYYREHKKLIVDIKPVDINFKYLMPRKVSIVSNGP